MLAELGDPDRAAWHRRKGFKPRSVVALPFRGQGTPVQVLQFVSALGGNIPTRTLLDDPIFQTAVVVAEFFDATRALPLHQLTFIAIGDADLGSDALAAAKRLAASSGAPLMNLPSTLIVTGRAENAQRLSRIPGVVAPTTMNLPGQVLLSPEAGGS